MMRRFMHSDVSVRFHNLFRANQQNVGLSIFCQCDIETFLLCNVQLYVGKENQKILLNKSIGIKNILNLGTTIVNNGFGAATDNILTPVFLAESFWEEKLSLVQTMRADKRAILTQFHKNKKHQLHRSSFICSKDW